MASIPPDRCKKLIPKCRNTALFLDKTGRKPMILDLTNNEAQKQGDNIVSQRVLCAENAAPIKIYVTVRYHLPVE